MGRVLVIDDEPDVLLLCRLNLEQRGQSSWKPRRGARPSSWPGSGSRT